MFAILMAVKLQEALWCFMRKYGEVEAHCMINQGLNSFKKGLGPNVIHSVVFFIYFCLVRFGRIFF